MIVSLNKDVITNYCTEFDKMRRKMVFFLFNEMFLEPALLKELLSCFETERFQNKGGGSKGKQMKGKYCHRLAQEKALGSPILFTN